MLKMAEIILFDGTMTKAAAFRIWSQVIKHKILRRMTPGRGQYRYALLEHTQKKKLVGPTNQ